MKGKRFECRAPIANRRFALSGGQPRAGLSGEWPVPIANRRRKSADDRLAAGLFDLGLGRVGELCSRDFEGATDLTIAENLHALLIGADESVFGQHVGVYLGNLRIERR